MENALWITVAAGLIANAFRSELKYASNSNFWIRLHENIKNAGVIFLAVFFLGSLFIDLRLFDPNLIALYIAEASATTAPYIAAIFVSLVSFVGRFFVGLSGFLRNRKGLKNSPSKEFVD